MLLEKPSLFTTKRDGFTFLSIICFILFYSLLIEYNNYKILTRFDSAIVEATILKQYSKTKKSKTNKIRIYQVLKLKSDDGYIFYTTKSMKFPFSKGKRVKLEIFIDSLSFYEYFKSFYAYSKIIKIYDDSSYTKSLESYIESQHLDSKISNIYKALYLAKPLEFELQQRFSSLGISHLFAISGFHLGIFSALLFFIIGYPYRILQNNFFPYRNSKLDISVLVISLLFSYLIFLDSPPSLLRAFVMFVIGFIIYDRGLKVLSIQTLLLTVFIILAFFPRLLFSIGFWLSVVGVYTIFIFLIYFKNINKILQFIFIPIVVYMLMLPYSLYIFSNFSIYHPFSILLTSLFTIFYPLSMILHIVGFGGGLDSMLKILLEFKIENISILLDTKFILLHTILLFLAMWKKSFFVVVLLYSVGIFIYALMFV